MKWSRKLTILIATMSLGLVVAFGCEKSGLTPKDEPQADEGTTTEQPDTVPEQPGTTPETGLPPDIGTVPEIPPPPPPPPPPPQDTDGDGIPDSEDPDIDGDGIPNELDQDDDGDGYTLVDDCDDTNPNIHPGAIDLPNFIDENCDQMDGEVATAVWVSRDEADGDDPANLSDDVHRGFFGFPFKTIAKAIEAVQTEGDPRYGKDIYVVAALTANNNPAFYQEELEISGDVDLYGGYSKLQLVDGKQIRKRDTSHYATKIANLGNNPTILIKSNADDVENIIQGFDEISGRNGKPAIEIDSSNVRLEKNRIQGLMDPINSDRATAILITNDAANRAVNISENYILAGVTKNSTLEGVGSVAVKLTASEKTDLKLLRNTIFSYVAKRQSRGVFFMATKGTLSMGDNSMLVGSPSTLLPSSEAGRTIAVHAAATKVDLRRNKIRVDQGKDLQGMYLEFSSVSAEESMVVNNMISVGSGNFTSPVKGLVLRDYFGYIANNSIWLNSTINVNKQACGVQSRVPDKINLINNIVDANSYDAADFQGIDPPKRYGVCLASPGKFRKVVNNYFTEELSVLYYGQVDPGGSAIDIITLNTENNVVGLNDMGDANHEYAGNLLEHQEPFIDPENLDLHIKPDLCKALEKGINLNGVFKRDCDGEARGLLWDIGADQCPNE